MNAQLDPQLKCLFDRARQDLDGEALTERVVATTRKRTRRLLAVAIVAALAVLTSAWLILAMPLLEFGVLLSRVLTTSLIDLGDGWLALLLLPINSLAGVLALCTKGALLVRKWLSGTGHPR